MDRLYQTQLDGEPDESVNGGTTDAIRQFFDNNPINEGEVDDEELSAWNRRCFAYVYAREGSMIRACQLIGLGKPHLGIHPDTDKWIFHIQEALINCPHPESFSRASRNVRNGSSFKLACKTKFQVRQGKCCSNTETKFKAELNAAFPTVVFDSNVTLLDLKVTPDFICEELRIAIDLDSWAFHNSQDSFIRDREVSRKLQLAGYIHLRYAEREYKFNMDGIKHELAKVIAMRKEEIEC